MKQINTRTSTVLVLKRGEELMESLDTFTHKTGLASAWLSGVGGAAKATIGFYDIETKTYQWKEHDEPLEIISLTGNLAIVDGQPFWHIHGVFSGSNLQAIGGHVRSLIISLTGELHITPLAVPLQRTFDETTGLKLIA
jgi:predicted DNA-binding protein with PD1-like motif